MKTDPYLCVKCGKLAQYTCDGKHLCGNCKEEWYSNLHQMQSAMTGEPVPESSWRASFCHECGYYRFFGYKGPDGAQSGRGEWKCLKHKEYLDEGCNACPDFVQEKRGVRDETTG